MKIVDWFIRISLMAMIALSLFLSWKIWTNSGTEEVAKKNGNLEVSQNLKEAKDVFLPTHLIYHDQLDRYYYTNRESLLANVTKEVMEMEWGRLIPFTPLTDKDVFVTTANSAELLLSAHLDLAYFFEINNKSVTGKVDHQQKFNRLVIALDEETLYFLDDEAQSGYKLSLKGSLKKTTSLLRAKDNRYNEVVYRPSHLAFSFYFEEELRLKTYSYILGMQSYTVFSQAFFDSDDEITSNDNSESKDINLLSDSGSSLKASYATGEVTYSGRFDPEANTPLGTHNLFSQSYYYVQKLANAMGTIRYFDRQSEQIVYRNFVEGYPIFSDFKKGRIELQILGQNIQIETNQETIQVPIPSEEEVVLESTADTLLALETAGLDLETIEDMRVGYTWKVNEETKQAIDLVPEWYLRIDGTWDNQRTLTQHLLNGKGEADGF